MTTQIKFVQNQVTTLAGAGVSVGDSVMTLVSFNNIDGTPLTMANFGIKGYGTIQPAEGAYEEQISFTGIITNGDGTRTLTGIFSVLNIYPYTETANLAMDHVGGTSFVVSNTAGFYGTFANTLNDEDITGVTWLIDNPTVARQIANKQYVDGAVISGGVPASEANPGIVTEATQAEVDAKTAQRLYVPTGLNYRLFVDPLKMRSTKYNDYVLDTGAVNVYVITPAPVITAYNAGQQFTFKVATTNTAASTLNVNNVGAQAIVKNINQALSGSELLINSIVTVIYDGTNFVMQSTTALGALSGRFTNGIATQSINGASATKTITHNLGVVPTKIRLNVLTAIENGTGASGIVCIGAYDASGQSATSARISAAASEYPVSYSGAAYIALVTGGGATPATTGVIGNLTSTTFDIVFTGAVSNGNTHIMWEVEV